jgi:hypothetical protein
MHHDTRNNDARRDSHEDRTTDFAAHNRAPPQHRPMTAQPPQHAPAVPAPAREQRDRSSRGISPVMKDPSPRPTISAQRNGTPPATVHAPPPKFESKNRPAERDHEKDGDQH